MSDLRKAAEQALEALEANLGKWRAKTPAIEALRQALEMKCPCQVNQYKVIFSKPCPVNNLEIKYKLKIKTTKVILVEDLLEFVENLQSDYHEIFADRLAQKFGGNQVLTGFHHGVYISTKR